LTGFNRYGENWDEQVDFQYGEDAIAHYAGPDWYWREYGNLRNYGPAYLAAANSVAARLLRLAPDWNITDARHFVNHLAFQIATASLFFFCLRFMGSWAALATSLLFATQPLLFGHSFINQKDVPFMAGFLLAATLGVRLSDAAIGTRDLGDALRKDWQRVSKRRKGSLVAYGVLAAAAGTELLLLMRVVLPFVLAAVAAAYRGESIPLVNEWFARLAQRASELPVEAYQLKATTLYLQFRWLLLGLAVAPFAGLSLRTFRTSLRVWWKSEAGLVLIGFGGGAAAGLTAATRVMGFAVVLLVGLVVVLRRGWSGVPTWVVFAATASVACYAAWPYLHGAPIQRFWESVVVMSRYPWGSGILYRGHVLRPEELPWSYAPHLIGIQLTLPAVFLAVVGIPLAAIKALKDKRGLPEYLVMVAWAGGPVAAVAFLNSTLYGNFRQMLFVLPPLFVFAGGALEAVAVRIRSRAVVAVLAFLVLAPGVAGIVRLHPYEYLYYNALVGGVRGAFRSYELDYWCTSYREAMDWINREAPPGAVIAVAPPDHVARHYARSDLLLTYAQVPQDLGDREPILGLGCGRGDNDLGFFPEYAVASEVGIQGARLAVIRDFRRPLLETVE
jgi:hypothetical protein